MSPDELLRQIRLTVGQMQVEDGPVSGPVRASLIQHGRDLAELVTALDAWLSSDGVLPTDWLPEEEKP
jgi:hypothetical protein